MKRHSSALLAVILCAGALQGPVAAAPPPESSCPLFPETNVWNKRVDALPKASNSKTLIGTIGRSTHLHPDFGEYLGYGIPYNLVDSTTTRRTVHFDYDDESD
ncbi:MAG TPA: hypothetical protein VFK61_01040, partial [Candidatus Limnocylindria bacterium]|nr:hypothetical protein [Candidatus Limnocylindria bacterium]